ncbi:hypothetical protein UUU_22710 [Klebsiella pneumoniae subsp. pneumoniae DSM 30104 = JCM 1662 = NBRC 14940]|nr:hypothetical protein UUU_22710 [Klebsiella pneumoniae subsp. pneumoniae DSM 30104 = JCM 1662 = NBRC 14940]
MSLIACKRILNLSISLFDLSLVKIETLFLFFMKRVVHFLFVAVISSVFHQNS